jgi:hypothetical protein
MRHRSCSYDWYIWSFRRLWSRSIYFLECVLLEIYWNNWRIFGKMLLNYCGRNEAFCEIYWENWNRANTFVHLTRLKKIKKNLNKYHIGWGIEVAPMIGTSDPSGVFEVAASISFLKKEKNMNAFWNQFLL